MTVTRGFVPKNSEPTEKEKFKTFIEEQFENGKYKCDIEKNNLYRHFNRSKGNPKLLYKTYIRFWELIHTSKKTKVVKYLSKVFIENGFETQLSRYFSLLSIMGLVDVVADPDAKTKAGPSPYVFSLGPNAWSIENGEAVISFSEEELKIRQRPWRTNSKRSSSKTKEFKEEEKDDELPSTSLSSVSPVSNLVIAKHTMSNHSLANLFAITERIHVDFKELERRLEQRKPANPKQYYQDLRLIEHLKGEFSALMISVLPENEEDRVVQNPGELDNVVQVLQLTSN